MTEVERKVSFATMVVSTMLMWIVSAVDQGAGFVNFIVACFILICLHPGFDKKVSPELMEKIENVKSEKVDKQVETLVSEPKPRKRYLKSDAWYEYHGRKMKKNNKKK